MALDEALFHSVQAGISPPVLRLYRWSRPTVTLGYGQRGARQVNLAACHELGVDLVRRSTGGRAVLHAAEVTYAVISPEGSTSFSASILDNYRQIAAVLRACLTALGLPVELATKRLPHQKRRTVEKCACFVAPSHFELLCHGRKICGSAQKRENGCFLQHGSLPVDLDLSLLFSVLNCDTDIGVAEGRALLAKSVGWINRWAPQPLTLDQVQTQLKRSFEEILPAIFYDDCPTAEELKQAAELEQTRYAEPGWSFRKGAVR